MDIIEDALKKNRNVLSEYESKLFLASYQIPVTAEKLVDNIDGLKEAAEVIGYPLVLKGSAAGIAHKTEKGLIRVDIRNQEEAISAYDHIMAAMHGDDKAILVQQMIRGQRELVIGLTRDSQFGPCVMFGLGGIFTEVLNDTTFRVAPLQKKDAMQMMQEIKAYKILESVRGMPPADKDMLADMLVTVGRIGLENEVIKEIDINPVIIADGKPIAVDALIVLEKDGIAGELS